MSLSQLVDRFTSIALEQDRAIRDDDNRLYNSLYDQMEQVREELKRRPGDQRKALAMLLEHSNAQVRLKAAITVLKPAPDDARRALQRIVDQNEYPQAADARGMLMSLDAGSYIPN